MSAPNRLDRALIRVSGPEAKSFLQNVLTQDLDGDVSYAALLSPQGKVVADMFAWNTGDALVLDADPARGADLLRRLSMYKLRAQATLEDVSDSLTLLWSDAQFDGASSDPRLPALGWRKLAPKTETPEAAAAYDARRIAIGVPDLARDAQPEEVFALEALLEELNGVDFQKGCFVGQENVSRMKRRATTRRKFCPIVFDGAPPAFGTSVLAGEAELGTVRSGVDGRAIALLRLDRALEAEAPLSAGGKHVKLDPPHWLVLPAKES